LSNLIPSSKTRTPSSATNDDRIGSYRWNKSTFDHSSAATAAALVAAAATATASNDQILYWSQVTSS
jgi:hypothetical protein